MCWRGGGTDRLIKNETREKRRGKEKAEHTSRKKKKRKVACGRLNFLF